MGFFSLFFFRDLQKQFIFIDLHSFLHSTQPSFLSLFAWSLKNLFLKLSLSKHFFFILVRSFLSRNWPCVEMAIFVETCFAFFSFDASFRPSPTESLRVFPPLFEFDSTKLFQVFFCWNPCNNTFTSTGNIALRIILWQFKQLYS